jgi:Cysteine-rich secretory protein family
LLVKISDKLSYFLALIVPIMMTVETLQAASAPYSHGDPTDLEQYMLELVNRARTNPAQEGRFLDQVNTAYSRQSRADHPEYFTNLPVEFSAYLAAPPLAFNPVLLRTAREHSSDMVSNNYFAHNTPSGHTPFERMTNEGYQYATAGENLSGMGCLTAADVVESHYGLMVDCYNISDATDHLGHRLNLLTADFKEVGIGFAGTHDRGAGTQDFASRQSNPVCFIVGVVYRDKNSNGQYDPGEGISNVLVTPNLGGNMALTSASGGYAVPISPVETNTVTTNIPLNLKTASWSQVVPYDDAFLKASMDSAPPVTVDITMSGSNLPSTGLTHVSLKRPTLINYTLKGKDNYFYKLSTVTSLNVKADYVVTGQGSFSNSPSPSSSPSPTPSPVVISFPQPADQSYSLGGLFELGAAVPGGSVAYESSNLKVLKVSGSTALIVGVGQSEITARAVGGVSAAAVKRTVTVSKGEQSITPFGTLASRTYGDTPFTIIVPAATSGLPVAVTVLSGPAKLARGKISLTGAGTVTLAANQPGNALYQKAPRVTVSFTVAKATQVIGAFSAIADQTYPLARPLRITVPGSSSRLPVTPAVKSGPATLVKSKGYYVLKCSAPGDVVISANQPGSANYLPAAEVTATVHVR